MTTLIKNFIADESGAVTVDWVVLTAAVVGMAMAAYTAISPSATDMNTRTSTQMTNFNPFQ
jgi:Flp pilus assembly pilin Flp